jgi:hypothetical protein
MAKKHSATRTETMSAGQCTSAEKVAICRNMKDGKIDLLVAAPSAF